MYVGRILEATPRDMADFDPRRIANTAREVLETIKEPHRRRILENFIEHADAECTGDYDRLIKSCSSISQSYVERGGSNTPEEIIPKNVEMMKAYYMGMMQANTYLIDGEIEKLIVGDNELYVELILHQLYHGEIVQMAFAFDFAEPGKVYQLTKRVATVFIFDQHGKGCAEHSWIDGPVVAEDFTLVPEDQVPALFWERSIHKVA